MMQLTDVIGELFGERNECVEACALFEAAAERLGLPVSARAVSILAVTESGVFVSTGREGAEQSKDAGVAVPLDDAVWTAGPHDFEHAGHMVITSKELSLLVDPTFRQFRCMGLPDVVLGGPVATVAPEAGRITLKFPTAVDAGEVTYFFDDGNSGWQKGFQHAKQDWATGGVASAVASHVAGGGWGDNLTFALPWDLHPGH